MDRRMMELPHVTQSHDWDCGLACVQMVARYYHVKVNVEQACQDLDIDNSVWTIDLAYILSKHDIPNQLYTITLGVDASYANQPFYRNNYDKDTERVQQLFENSSQYGLKIEKQSKSSMEIAEHILGGDGPVIALVDYNYLFCDSCSRTCMFLDTAYSLFRQCGSSYQGHYITICGVDVSKARFYYRNPGYHDEMCTCSFERMDQARCQHGTDEDVVFVYRPERTG